MSPPMVVVTPLNLPDHCTPTSHYLVVFSSAFHTCVPTTLAFLSTFLGVCSIISWLFAQIPQIYKNYQLQSAASLSIFFLAEWLLGDLTNLTGAFLTDQETWQIVVASYYVTVDICLVVQYVWYSRIQTLKKQSIVAYDSDGRDESEDSREVILGVSPNGTNPIEIVNKVDSNGGPVLNSPNESLSDQTRSADPDESSVLQEKMAHVASKRTLPRSKHNIPLAPSSKPLLLISILCVALSTASPLHPTPSLPKPYVLSTHSSSSELIGRILSWVSTILYLGSRLPQIYKNFTRKSTSGLSPILFIAAFFGNLFYSSSLLTNPLAWSSYPPYGLHGWVGSEGSDRATWISLAAPFWLGAAGVLALDATVGVQFLVYGEGREAVVLLEDRKGRGRWRKVTGWMRGWVPSPRRDAVRGEEEDDEERRPLVEGRRGSGVVGYGGA